MTEKKPSPKKWGMTSADYATRAAENRARRQGDPNLRAPFAGDPTRALKTGRIAWRPGAVNVDLIQPASVDRSICRFEKSLPEMVWNVAALEDDTFTLPQVRTRRYGDDDRRRARRVVCAQQGDE